ncbi:MAG: AMP-binding protein, partial [Eubacteriales bacterium]|nr:AMP-binding protein [Eubacteriales bacterium]
MLNKLMPQVSFNSYDDFVKGYNINIPDNFNFAYDVVDKTAEDTPDKKALIWCDESGHEATFTFGEIKALSNRAANFFLSAGMAKGDPVMLILKRRYEFWPCILALHKIGAICIPATHLLTAKDITYRCNAADIRMIVSVNEPETVSHIKEASANSPSLKKVAVLGSCSFEGWYDLNLETEKASPFFERPLPGSSLATINSDIMLLYFTSGTTGMPKMVMHDFTYPLGHILTAKYWHNLDDRSLHLTVADTGWAKAVWGKLYGQWLSGAAIFVYDYNKFVPADMISVIAKYGVTSFCAPPTIYRFLIKEDLSVYDLSRLKYCTVAGEPLNPEVYNRFLEMTGIRLMEGYGQTELTVAVATYPWMTPKPGSMGKPSPGYEIDLVNENGASCSSGEEGQIVIRTGRSAPFGMFRGYYRDGELTSSVWHDDVYYTGDMAWKDEDGYFWFVGRADDVIKSSGYRIGPFEVESALLEHSAVLECAITAV